MITHYHIARIVHIVFVIFFMAGMLYLPRLFVYHVKMRHKPDVAELLLTMESKLLNIIMLPAAIIVSLSGLYLLCFCLGLSHSWLLYTKLLLALVMFAMHGFFVRCHKALRDNRNKYSEKFFRIINEVPAILVIAITAVAVIRRGLSGKI